MHESAIAAGKVVERHLCEACAAKQGIAPGAGTGLTPEELAKKLLAAHTSAADAVASGKLRTHCPTCNLPFAAFREGGLLGCPDCYASFELQLGPMLERYHEGGARHVGKAPRRGSGASGRGGAAGKADAGTPAVTPAVPARDPGAHLPPRAERARAPEAPAQGAPTSPAPAPAQRAPDERAKRIAMLRAQLADAIRKEQYEVAAQLRDALKALGDPSFGDAPPAPPPAERGEGA